MIKVVNFMFGFFIVIEKVVKEHKKICHTNTNQKKAGVGTLIRQCVHLRTRAQGNHSTHLPYF